MAAAILLMSSAFAAGDERPSPSPDNSSLKDVRLILSSDRDSYYVGELLKLRLRAHNGGQTAASGFFGINDCDVQYGAANTAFSNLFERNNADSIDVVRLGTVIQPGANRDSTLTIGATKGPPDWPLALPLPGEYSFRARCAPQLVPGLRESGFPNLIWLESNVISVSIRPTPPDQAQAFADYMENQLVVFVQAPVWRSQEDPTAIGRAARFLDRHPESPFAAAVRPALLSALSSKISAGHVTLEEAILYERLKPEVFVPKVQVK